MKTKWSAKESFQKSAGLCVMEILPSEEKSFSEIVISQESVIKLDVFWGINQVLSVLVQGKGWRYPRPRVGYVNSEG